MTKRTKRTWHPNFKKYMKSIIKHKNYAGMPFTYNKDGSIGWVVTGKSKIGMARRKWWDEKRKQLRLPKGYAWISKTARANHPTGKKVCQVCGETKKLDYIYPNKRNGMSPGAMSNAPDRLDGYHTYNLCCRPKHDTGRHASNMARYGEDRRAYENWSEGDLKSASWLMKVFKKHGLSPDHVGPISLGFRHRAKFRPLTKAANAARNNRMTLEDVQQLLQEELTEPVISSHSKFIWNLLKNKVTSDSDALKLGKLMRENMHYILLIFSYLAERGGKKFLIKNFLNPVDENYSVAFIGFDPKTGNYEKMIKTPGDKKQYKNQTKRRIRISLESLKRYALKKNRNHTKKLTPEIEKELSQVISNIVDENEGKALVKLFKVLKNVAQELSRKFSEEA